MDPGTILVSLHGGRNLVGIAGAPSTFVLVSTLDRKGNRRESKRSHTVRKDSNPHWDMQLVFDVDEDVDQLEFALYDREGMIVDELVGVLLLPHQRVSPNVDLVETWLAIQSTNKSIASSSSAIPPPPSPEMCITVRFIDAETKSSVEALQRAKSDTHQRRKEMRKLFNLDEEYLFDFSCNLDRGAVPGFGRVYITSSQLLYSSTFKKKIIAIEDIRYIEKYKTLLLANAGITLQLKNGRKIQLKSFKHRKSFLAALQQQAKNLGLQPIAVVDKESSDDHSGDLDSDEETESSNIARSPQDPSASPNQDVHSSSPSTTSPQQPLEVSFAISPATATSSASPPSSTKLAASAKLRESGEIEKSERKEKESHRRTPSAVAASIVRTVSDKLRNISSSSSNITHSKPDPSTSTSPPQLLSATSEAIPQNTSAKASQNTSSAFAGALASSSLQPGATQSTAHTVSISHSTSAIQASTKTKEKSSSFLKDFSLPFHLPGSKKKHHSAGQASTQQQHGNTSDGASSPTNALADDSTSSSEEEGLDDSVREREESRRLKYYLIHGEVPAVSGEDESEQTLPRRKKSRKTATQTPSTSLVTVSPPYSTYNPSTNAVVSAQAASEVPPGGSRSLRQATHSIRRSSDGIMFDENNSSELEAKGGREMSPKQDENGETCDPSVGGDGSDESDSSDTPMRSTKDGSDERKFAADSSIHADTVTTSSSDVVVSPPFSALHFSTPPNMRTTPHSWEGVERDDSSSCDTFFSPRGESSTTAVSQYAMPSAAPLAHPLAQSIATAGNSNFSSHPLQSQLQHRVLSSSWDIPSTSHNIHPLLHQSIATLGAQNLAASAAVPASSSRPTPRDMTSHAPNSSVSQSYLNKSGAHGAQAGWKNSMDDSDRSEDVDLTPRKMSVATGQQYSEVNTQSALAKSTAASAQTNFPGQLPPLGSTASAVPFSHVNPSPSKSNEHLPHHKRGRERRSEGPPIEISQDSSASGSSSSSISSSSSDDSIAGSADQSASSPQRPRRASASAVATSNAALTSNPVVASTFRALAATPHKSSSTPLSASSASAFRSEATLRGSSSKSIVVPPVATKSQTRKHSLQQSVSHAVEQPSKKNLSSMLLKSGIFSFCLALAILLRHSAPLYPQASASVASDVHSHVHAHQHNPQITRAFSGSYSDLLVFATLGAIGSLVSQLLTHSFCNKNVSWPNWTCTNSCSDSSCSPRPSYGTKHSQILKASSSSLSSKSTLKSSTSSTVGRAGSTLSSSGASHQRTKSSSSSSSSSSSVRIVSSRGNANEDGERSVLNISSSSTGLAFTDSEEATASTGTYTGASPRQMSANSTNQAAQTNYVVKEHLLPLLALMIGHTALLLTGFAIAGIVAHFGGDTGVARLVADLASRIALLGPKTGLLYVLFSSIGCHMIAKWQATAED